MRLAARRGVPTGVLDAEVWAALASPEAYPDDPSPLPGVSSVQTHLSHVFLTATRVYKFRKPVDLGFVRFTAREERNADCLREVALNRRLSRGVYLGVAPLRAGDGGVRVGPVAEGLAAGDGEVPEHCVVMRRLPDGRDALSLLEKGALRPDQLDRVAARLAGFHARANLGRPAPFSREEWRKRCTGPVDDNLRMLAEAPAELVPRALLSRVAESAHAFAAQGEARFERRRVDGRVADAHGDLHLQHIWFEEEDAEPQLIDCLEFSERLRRIDAASEVAFLAMDLRYRGASAAAERFLRHYARDADDYDLYAVVDYFASYRAGVRAKVAAIAAGDAEIGADQRGRSAASARRHLELAATLLEPRPPGGLVLVGGVVGTGKSTAAEELAQALGGVVISSDRVRKRLLGLPPTARGGAEGGLYTPEHTERTYAALLDRARAVVGSGRPAILDATFGVRAQRARARRWARDHGARSFFVEARCSPEVARERLARRSARGSDPSDAGPGRYEASARAFEALEDWPAAERVDLATDRDDWRRRARRIAARLAPMVGSV